MTATSFTLSAARSSPAYLWAAPLALTLGLGAIVGARLLAVRSGLDPLLVGAAFGGALGALALAGRVTRDRIPAALLTSTIPSIVLGASVGLVLTIVAVVGPSLAGASTVPGLGRPAAPFVPWAVVTFVVVAAEEGLLRGALFDRVEHAAGLAAAIVLTTLVFAFMHVPLYGWHVVPLDLAVGLVLAGLRISTRGLLAPIAAHATADLASWWL
jgi:membrane protease YdiL (CAAX protease family)